MEFARRHQQYLEECLVGSRIPMFCIGGINPENIGTLREAGATRFAVSSAVTRADDPIAAAQRIHESAAAAQ